MKKIFIIVVLLSFLMVPVLALAQEAPVNPSSSQGTVSPAQNSAPTTNTQSKGQLPTKMMFPGQQKTTNGTLKSQVQVNQKNSIKGKRGKAGMMLAIALWILLTAILFAFWLWMLIDLLIATYSDSIEKLIWVLIVLTLMPLGALLYLIIGRNKKQK